MKYNYNDGGRALAGYEGKARDCVCRAISITTQLPYQQIYDKLCEINKQTHGKSSARDGILTKSPLFKKFMYELGFTWVATMRIGQGCKVHLREGEVPMGRIICSVSRHYVAVIDGVVNDIFNPTRNGNRCVYGYWTLAR
ncbi:MAG: hypothetical protein EBR82_67690 [Caulobacteraceae bacterium]|nr:hypothetical protein [Caulobacteraceae bacterium]